MLSLWRGAGPGVEVVRLIEMEERAEVVRLFEDVAQAEGWRPEGALRMWTHRSVYFGVQVEGQVVGGLQLVLPDTRGTLPCQELWPEVPLAVGAPLPSPCRTGGRPTIAGPGAAPLMSRCWRWMKPTAAAASSSGISPLRCGAIAWAKASQRFSSK